MCSTGGSNDISCVNIGRISEVNCSGGNTYSLVLFFSTRKINNTSPTQMSDRRTDGRTNGILNMLQQLHCRAWIF